MRHLFVVRHGKYDCAPGGKYVLSEDGRNQMSALAAYISGISNNLQISSSPEDVAIQSARALGDEFGLPVEESFELWSDNLGPAQSNRYGDSNRVHAYVQDKQYRADSFIVLSHKEICEKYPTFFLKTELGQDQQIPLLKHGQMVHFDLERRVFELFPTNL